MKTLAKEHGYLVANQAGGVWSIDETNSQGWRLLAAGGIFASDTYFDLAGMSMREKTLFFEAATVQELVNPMHFQPTPGTGAGDSMVIVDLMACSPLTDAELSKFFLYGNFAFNGGPLSFAETIYARVNQYVVDLDTQAWGSFVQVSSNQLGSLEATASDRVYSYRIVYMGTPTNADRVDVLSARHLLKVNAREEAEYEYLMRLKRSYELQQSYDED